MRRLTGIVTAMVLMLGVLGTAPPADAAPCIIGPIYKAATFKYQDQEDSTPGHPYYVYVRLAVSACYNNTTSFGRGISVTQWGGLWLIGPPLSTASYSTSGGSTTFSYSPAWKESGGLELHAYPRMRISKTGVWSVWDAGAVITGPGGTVKFHGDGFDPVFISWSWS